MENRIKEILSEKGMTAIELSNLVGISRVSLSNIINDKQEASANTLNSIAKSLDVPFCNSLYHRKKYNQRKTVFLSLVPIVERVLILK